MDDLFKVIIASKFLPQKKEWTGLTEKEIETIKNEHYTVFDDIYKAIEAKLKEKNHG